MPQTDWGGIYIGGHFGGAFMRNNGDVDAAEFVGHHADAALGGVQIGLQRQFRDIVLGSEVSYSWTNPKARTPSTANPGVDFLSEASNIWMWTSKLGLARDRWMIYAKGGIAWADIKLSSEGLLNTSTKHNESGWVVGGGWSYMMHPGMILSAEYNYINFDIGDRDQGLGHTITNLSSDIQTVTVRLDFKFGDHRREERVPPLK